MDENESGSIDEGHVPAPQVPSLRSTLLCVLQNYRTQTGNVVCGADTVRELMYELTGDEAGVEALLAEHDTWPCPVVVDARVWVEGELTIARGLGTFEHLDEGD